MLVLTRKAQEQIRINDNITVTILRIKGNTVRVGIEAPRDVHVVRGELTLQLSDVEADGEAGASASLALDASGEGEEPAIQLRVDRRERRAADAKASAHSPAL